MSDDTTPHCSFCPQTATFGPFDGIRVCARCSKELGRLLTRGDAASLWAAMGSGETKFRSSRIATHDDPGEPQLDHDLAKLKERVAAVLEDDDAQSHADLAIAYGEMELMDDALREASLVLVAGRPGEATRQVLRLILTPPLWRSAAFTELKAKMKRQRASN